MKAFIATTLIAATLAASPSFAGVMDGVTSIPRSQLPPQRPGNDGSSTPVRKDWSVSAQQNVTALASEARKAQRKLSNIKADIRLNEHNIRKALGSNADKWDAYDTKAATEHLNDLERQRRRASSRAQAAVTAYNRARTAANSGRNGGNYSGSGITAHNQSGQSSNDPR